MERYNQQQFEEKSCFIYLVVICEKEKLENSFKKMTHALSIRKEMSILYINKTMLSKHIAN